MEPTSSKKKSDFEDELALVKGFPSDKATWGPTRAAVIANCIKSGVDRFYKCGYAWSFLKPFATLDFLDGETTVALPDDFGGLEGKIYILDTSSRRPVPVANPGIVEQMHAQIPDTTGVPQVASIRTIKGTSLTKSSRQELYLFPEADDD
jgi:hypothetical protein